jgi:polysaccharide deacetylase family protein (PEP-CTERM system associated)
VPITFTLDLEDHRVGTPAPVRCARPTHDVLRWLDQNGARGTFFVVATLAHEAPELIRAVADAGHEVALHALHHVPIAETGQARFLPELREGKAILEDLTGRPVVGYRAPIFSLTAQTPWAPAALAEAGFTYSSSVLPANNPLHGLAGAPRTPFRWTDGPVELPCPVFGRGSATVPFLGGVYLRYLPMPIVEFAARRAGRTPAGWAYTHPYDFDTEEPFEVLPHAGYVTSRIVHHRRGGTLKRVDRVIAAGGGFGPPLEELAGALPLDALPTYSLSAGAPAAPR